MLNYLISLGLLITSIQSFAFFFAYGGIDRSFRSLSRGVIEQAVVALVSADGTYDPRYDEAALETEVIAYLNGALKTYTETYRLGFYYYDVTTQTTCSGNLCDGVQIHLLVPLGFGLSYDRERRYEIHTTGNAL